MIHKSDIFVNFTYRFNYQILMTEQVLPFFNEKECISASVYFFMFKRWSAIYKKGKAFVTFSNTLYKSPSEMDNDFTDAVSKNDIQFNIMFPQDLILTGPVLFLKHKQQEKPLLNLFIPNYLIQKCDTKTIRLIPLTDILQTIIKITFNEEKTQKSWFAFFTEAKRVIEKPTIPVLFPLLDNSPIYQQTASVDKDSLNLVITLSDKTKIENEIHFNSSFIIASPFEYFMGNRNHLVPEQNFIKKDELYMSLMISTSKTSNFICKFDQIDTLLAAFCNIYQASKASIANNQFLKRENPIYIRQKRYEGITTEFQTIQKSTLETPHVLSLTKKINNISFKSNNILPDKATTRVKILDFDQPVHRTIVFSDAKDLYPKPIVPRSETIPIMPQSDVYNEEIKRIIDSLGSECDQEMKDWETNLQNGLNESFQDDIDDLFMFKEPNQESFFNKDAIELNDKFYTTPNNQTLDKLLSANEIELNRDPEDNFYDSNIITSLRNCLKDVSYTLNLDSESFHDFMTLVSNIITDTCDPNTFCDSLLWLLDSHFALKKCFPLQTTKPFEELIVTFVSRLLITKQLHFLIETISSDTQWCSDVYSASSLMNCTQFIPEFLNIIYKFEEINFVGSFHIKDSIHFKQYGHLRYDILIEKTASELLHHIHEGNDSKCATDSATLLSSQIARFINIGFYHSYNATNAWSIFMRTNEFGFQTNELTLLQETIKRAEKNKEMSPNGKIAITMFTGIQLNMANIWLVYLIKGAKKLDTHDKSAPIFSYSQMSRVVDSLSSITSIKIEIPDEVFTQHISWF